MVFKKGEQPYARPPRPDEQCTYLRWGGVRCRRWATTGSNLCARHGGRKNGRGGWGTGNSINAQASNIVNKLPVFYSKVLGKTLHNALKECVASPDAELMNVRDELMLIRAAAMESVALYGALCDNDKSTPELRNTAAQMMVSALKDVVDVAGKMAQIDSRGSDKISLQNIILVSNQIVRCAHEVFGDDDPRVVAFQQMIEKHVRVPREDVGTSLTPDMDVREMDATIPREETSNESTMRAAG